jgi:hypothetical protein
MLSETRYACNGDPRVAYRASREGARDMVFISNWFTCCEHRGGAQCTSVPCAKFAAMQFASSRGAVVVNRGNVWERKPRDGASANPRSPDGLAHFGGGAVPLVASVIAWARNVLRDIEDAL